MSLLARLEAIKAVMVVSDGKGRFSGVLLAEAIITFYDCNKLWPRGITRHMECVVDWSGRMGTALQRLAT